MKKAMLIVLGLVGICLFAGARGWLGSDEELGEILEAPRPDATEAIRGGLSVFAHFSGFHGMDIESSAEGSRAAARHLRSHYDMANHAVAAAAHAQALDAEFIHRFGIAGPLDEAMTRFREIGESGIEFVRVVPGSRDMPAAVAGPSIQALAKVVGEVGS